ncbi:MAG: NUDIX hydrolase [Patescibacteria group bacterium]|nr:NUDIX hydrolase [Patescibacteria group bacterium]
MNSRIQRITAKGIIYRDNKILLLKDSKNVWELPGGKIEFGESPEISLVREFREEIGWNDLGIGKLVDVWDFTSTFETIDYQFLVVVFACNSTEEKIVLDKESIEYDWVAVSEIEKLKMKDGYKNSINKFLKEI